eukprot:11160612-Lingulodinium_polyedra.AAC.1
MRSREVSLEASANRRQSMKTRVESTNCRSQPTGNAALARGNPPLGWRARGQLRGANAGAAMSRHNRDKRAPIVTRGEG